MTQAPLRLGFVGGSITSAVGYTHYIASQMDHRWSVVAGCFSRDVATNNRTGNTWGISENRVYASWEELLVKEQGQIDAIAVLTPTSSHTEIVLQALKLGHNVICEKAMTSSIEDAKKIIEAKNSSNSFLAVTYNYTGYPMIRELRSIIEMGELGKISQIQIEMPQEGFARVDSQGNRPSPQPWRLVDEEIPTISLDLGVHLHNLVYLLTKQHPISVVSDQSSFGWFPQVIDNVMCIARYTNDLKCQAWFSKSAIGHRNGLRVRVYGTLGSAEWYQMSPEELMIYTQKGDRKIIDRASTARIANEIRYNRFKAGHPAGFLEAFANLYYDLAEALQSHKTGNPQSNPWVFGADIALEGLVMMSAIARSAKDGQWIPVNQTLNISGVDESA